MGWPTGYIGVVTSRPTMKWWANGSADSGVMGLMGRLTVKWWGNVSADRVHWSCDQSANSEVVG